MVVHSMILGKESYMHHFVAHFELFHILSPTLPAQPYGLHFIILHRELFVSSISSIHRFVIKLLVLM